MALIFHTPGEPAGIGPELLVALSRRPCSGSRVAVASAQLLKAYADRLGLSLALVPFQEGQTLAAGQLGVVDVPLTIPGVPGQPDPANAAYVLTCLREAVRLARKHRGAIVTGPIHKATINDAGIAFSGHTEFLAAQTGCDLPVMMLVADSLRVALVTTHLPLRDVAAAISSARVRACLQILHQDLRAKFGIANPRIQVCGLNPHAGESGHLGHEDGQLIAPVIAQAQQQGWLVRGPIPADTAFTPHALSRCDAVLCMYHDQGLPVLKHVGFGRAVNVTLGLPLIRTSVDHGTAFDLAGRGLADPGSLIAAEALALDLLNS